MYTGTFEHFKSEGHSGFLVNVTITLADQTDGKNPKRRENYCLRTLKTYGSFGCNIEDCLTNPMRKYKCYEQAYFLAISLFFAILIRPSMDLGQDFLDIYIYIYLYFVYSLFPYQFILLCNLFLHYMLLLYMLVLFPLSGASYCTVYLFILVYALVQLNVL